MIGLINENNFFRVTEDYDMAEIEIVLVASRPPLINICKVFPISFGIEFRKALMDFLFIKRTSF